MVNKKAFCENGKAKKKGKSKEQSPTTANSGEIIKNAGWFLEQEIDLVENY